MASLEATDLDEAGTDNSRITYSITGISAEPVPDVSVDIGRHFALNSTSGGMVHIITNASLDFELITSYTITLTATDSGLPALSRYVATWL